MSKDDSIKYLNDVANEKMRLGDIYFLDFRSFDIVTAHQLLGNEVKLQVHKVLNNKVESLDDEKLINSFSLARRIIQKIKALIYSTSFNVVIKKGLEDYLECLSAWAKGAELEFLENKRTNKIRIDGSKIKPEEIALFLQNENVGCQTGVLREQKGSVILWHTEEDVEDVPGSHFDKLRIAAFTYKGRTQQFKVISSFIYPFLLPGPAFSWSGKTNIQAVDSLFLKSDNSATMCANIASWLSLFLGDEVSATEVFQSLSPYIDGYAITNINRSSNGVIHVVKNEFAWDYLRTDILGNNPGDYLFQVNIFSNRNDSEIYNLENLESNTLEFMNNRIRRTEEKIRSFDVKRNHDLDFFFSLLQSYSPENDDYANTFVKSYFIAQVSQFETTLLLGSGSALNGDHPIKIRL